MARRVKHKSGRYVLDLDPRERELIRNLLGELRGLLELEAGDPRLTRLYPDAYTDDAEAADEYRQLTHAELKQGRLANIELVEATLSERALDAEQLTAWMQAVNSLRLILGTMLGITDDDQELALDADDPEAQTQALYAYLGGLLDEIVDAQLGAL